MFKSYSHLLNQAEKKVADAMQMAANRPSAIRADEVEELARKAALRDWGSPDVEALSEAANRAYERFALARETGADIETLRRFSARFQVIATLEEAAKLRVQALEQAEIESNMRTHEFRAYMA